MIQVTVNLTYIDSGEIFYKKVKTFNCDKDSIEYLKNIDKLKMQTIADTLNKGVYKPSLILKNANSVYSISHHKGAYPCGDRIKATNTKPMYNDFIKANNIKTEIEILTSI